PVAALLGARLTLLPRGGLRLAEAEPDEACDGGQGDDQDAVAQVAEGVAEREADRDQAPEQKIAQALAIVAVGQAEHGPQGEQRARDVVGDVDVDGLGQAHRRALVSRFSRRSNIRSRAPWIRRAQTAEGIAQSEISSGCTFTPKPSMTPTIRSTAPMA